ncbi:unnamed protein product [Symbiodinium sp. CCMP2592]|nr:unnamed protein product [Symbiodinium sp. CCMP2592]
MLRDLVGNILEPGLKAAGHGQDLDAQEMDLHFLLVRKLKEEDGTLQASLSSDDCAAAEALSALQTRGLALQSSADDPWKEVMSSIVPLIQNLVFEDGKLAVAQEMRQAMGGACLRIEEYRTSAVPFSDFWQCGSDTHDNFGDAAYTPSEQLMEKLVDLSGVQLPTWARLHLHSGNESDALYGKWCGMPAPPEYEDEMGRPVGNRKFWEDCVMRNAGYFNALVCDTDGAYSVLGLAALNHGVCYPAHNHDNQEAYWQLGGPGWWKTWPKTFHKQPNERPYSEIRITSPSPALQLHNHPGGVVHEMDTTHDDDYLLTVYWWGKPANQAVNYAYSHNVQEQGSCFRTYRNEHADVQHSCPNPYRPPWAAPILGPRPVSGSGNAYLRTVKNPKVDVRITKRAQDNFASKVVEVDPEEEPPELPEHISSKLLYYLQSARQLTKNSLEQMPHNTEAASFWKPCGELLGACLCTGLARLAVQGASSAIAFTPSIAVSDVIFCHNSSFPQVVWEDGVRGFPDSDSWCECLSLDATGPSDVRTHLALLHREFADVFCEGNGGCSEARVSLPLAPAPPVDMESPFKATDAVAESPKSKLTVKWFIIGISSALGIIFLSFVSYRLRYHGAIHG